MFAFFKNLPNKRFPFNCVGIAVAVELYKLLFGMFVCCYLTFFRDEDMVEEQKARLFDLD